MLEITFFDSKKGLKGEIGLSIGLTALVLMIIAVFPSIEQTGFDLTEYIEAMPPALAKAFGATIADYTTLEGFLGLEFYSFFWLVAIGAYFAYRGGGLIAGEVEDQRIDIVLSSPIRRSRIVFEKFFSLIPVTLILNIFVIATVLGGSYLINESIDLILLIKTHILSIPFWLACGSLGLLVSVLIDEERRAEIYSVAIVFGTYLIETVTADTDYGFLSKFSLTKYYEPVKVISGNGIDMGNTFVLGAITIISLTLAMYIFEKKDVK